MTTPTDEQQQRELKAAIAALSSAERERLKAVLGDEDPATFESRHRWSALRERTLTRVRTQAPILLIAGAAGFAAGWLFNVFVMGRRYDGYRVPSGTPATGEGNLLRGSVFYFLVSMIVTGVVAYRLTVGKEQFWTDVRELPQTMRKAVRDDGDSTTQHLLVGFAGSMVIVVAVGQSISAGLAVGVLLLFGRVLRPIVTVTLMWLWRKVAAKIAPQRQRPPSSVAMLVGLLGSAGAFALGWAIPSRDLQVLLGIAAAVGAVVIARKGKEALPGSTVAWLAVGTIGLLLLVRGEPALADDGGFSECGNPGLFSYIFDCGGSFDVLLRSLFGGGATGLGAAVGVGLGGGADDDPDRKKFADLTEREKAARLLAYLRNKFPTADAAELRSYYDQLVDGTNGPTFYEALDAENEADAETARKIRDGLMDEASFLTSKEFLSAFGKNLWDDYSSDQMRERVGKTLVASVVGVKNAGEDLLKAGGALYEHRDELMAAGLDWMAHASKEEILEALAMSGEKMTKSAIADMQKKFAAFEKAAMSGDDDAMSKLIGDMAGSAAFDALLGAGMGKAIQKAGLDDLLKKVDGPGKKPDIEGPPRNPLDFERGYGDRLKTPYDKDQLSALMQDVKPGQKIKLTPEEAQLWSGIEKDRIDDLQNLSLTYSRGTGTGDHPWTELKKGSPDALKLREEGYVDKYGERQDYQPKPNFIENKSMKDWETKYGAPKDARAGEVVAYNPEPMPSKSEVSPDVYERLVQRQKEWERVQGGKNATSGPMYDSQGRRVQGEARVGDDGRWYTKSQTTDANGVRPGDTGYTETWSDWKRTGGDTDTFMMGGKGIVSDLDVDRHLRALGKTEAQINKMSPGARDQLRNEMDEAVIEAMSYKAGGGTIPGEGRTPVWDMNAKDYDPLKHFTTLKKTQAEGVLLVDADGAHLARPGEKYDLGLKVLENKLRATNPSDWTAIELKQLKEYGITPTGSWTDRTKYAGAAYGAANPPAEQ